MSSSGRCVTPAQLTRELEASRATLKRDIRHLRARMNAPVSWCRERGGWMLDSTQAMIGPQYELPGLWLGADDVHALSTASTMLTAA